MPGTNVLFCIHETRWSDYAEYAQQNPGIDARWKGQTHERTTLAGTPEDHPVGNVSWEDATAFCKWLSKKENIVYRLPTDEEWSVAAGLGQKEKWEPGDTPRSKSKNPPAIPDEYPWGVEWPPPKGAGNYSDKSRGSTMDYDDGFPTTAPVMSFSPNGYGIYDLGGNMLESVEDGWDEAKGDSALRRSSRDGLWLWLQGLANSGSRITRVARGASWETRVDENSLLSSMRFFNPPEFREEGLGFRVVLEIPEQGGNS